MQKISKIKVLIAPDKFRPKLTAQEVCRAIRSQLPSKYIAKCIPLADGGQGSLEAIQQSLKCERKQQKVNDPLFRQKNTYYLFDNSNKTAYIQMAKASGLQLLSKSERNPLKTSTYGTGELIKRAIQEGSKRIFLMIGGSSTNQAGIGAANALGYKFLDQNSKILKPIGENLQKIKSIIFQGNNILNNVQIKVSTDVSNPLLGPQGATYVFGSQKGAKKDQLQILEKGMKNLSEKFKEYLNKDTQSLQGGGAAGGLGAGAVALFNAQITPGVKTITQIVNLRQNIIQSDIVVTGEGKVDKQTLQGKLVKGVISLAKQYNKPVVVFCGKSQIDQKQLGENIRILQNQKQGMSDQESMENAQKLLRGRVRQYFI